jgi:4-hydroxythreonine-4-phosphate dehydrogenase
MPSSNRPLALTSGEPGGIGPEITAKAWQSLRHSSTPFVLIGDGHYWRERGAVPVEIVDEPDQAAHVFARALPVLHRPLAEHPKAGIASPATAQQVIASIDEAVVLAFAGKVAGLVTNPIQKETLYAAGFKHQGHTDYLAALAAERGFSGQEVMMLVAGDLRAIPVTVHIPLAEVPRQLTGRAIIDQARVVDRDLRRYFGVARPRLVVTGLNPHAGENGAMGSEDRDIIRPAVQALAAEGLDIRGPISADTAFHAEARATYDAILCMYHDQALIPVKTLDFHGGVNVTLGLPFIRTSPDHGTALDLAGTGKANPSSLIAALKLAADMAERGRGA